MSLARARLRAAEPAEQFVVLLRAVGGAVTHLGWVQTHMRGSTTIETDTQFLLTASFVLATWTVADTVAAQEDRQAVADRAALQVGLRTLAAVGGCQADKPLLGESHDCWWWDGV